MSLAISELLKNKKLFTAVNTLQAVIRSARRVHFSYGRTLYCKRKTLTRLSDDHILTISRFLIMMNYNTNKHLEPTLQHMLRSHKRSYVLMPNELADGAADPVMKSHRRLRSLSSDPGPLQLLALPFFNQKKDQGYEFLMATLITLVAAVLYSLKEADCEENKQAIPNYDDAIEKSIDLISRVKDDVGAPGVSIQVTVNGKNVWSRGFGYSDIENRTPCTPATVMRIASISKPISMTVIAKLLEDKKIDLDLPIENYVKTWPSKMVDGKKVTLTTRQVASHMSGVRHYDKQCGRTKVKSDSTKKEANKSMKSPDAVGDSRYGEFYSTKHYDSVEKSLEIFKDDDLCYAPGSKFYYTTHGYTLLSAVAESVSNKKIDVLLSELFKELGMKNTQLDRNDKIIYNRSRFYQRGKKLKNAPYADCSYKWTGGGILSDVHDLTRYGNIMLYSSQYNNETDSLPPYLKPETMKLLWTPESKMPPNSQSEYGLGWYIIPGGQKYLASKPTSYMVGHTGAAVGSSSVLVLMPSDVDEYLPPSNSAKPSGVVVAILCNMEQVSLNSTAMKIAELFHEASSCL